MLHFTIFSNTKQLLKIVIIFHSITVFTVFYFSNKCGLAEKKILFKTLENTKDTKLLNSVNYMLNVLLELL